MELFLLQALGRLSFTFNLKCVNSSKVKGPHKRRDYRVYEMVELRIYRMILKHNNSSKSSACRHFYKATKIIIDSIPYKYR
jgi:hypothetical protein